MATQPTQNPVPSESARDLKFNAGKIDEFVTSEKQQYIDRFGNAHRTIAGLNKDADQAMKAYGYITKKSFEVGATIDTPNTVLQWESNGEFYRWDGTLPKVVSAGSTPDSAGGIGEGKWIGVADASLRSDLTSDSGGDDIVSSVFGGDVKDAYISRQRTPGEGVHLFIVYGQSNAKGTAQNTPGAPDFVSPYARYWDGSALVPMTSYMKTSNDGTSTGSAWLSFANKYVGLSGKKTVFINSGKDSQSISQLQKGDASNNYANMLAYVNAAKSAITKDGLSIEKISVLFIQGERDEVINTGKATYKSALATLWSNIKNDTGATAFFNYTIGTYNNDTNPKRAFVIQAAQREL
ncbi:sialate O-acetylesterase [Cronobacter muytjensii]